MRKKSISIDETKDQEDDLIFHWVDGIEKKSFKKSVSFSNVVNLCLIETRKELDFASFNMYMNDYQYNLIRAEFQKHYDTFIKSNPQYKMKSRDEMTRNICEFIEQSKEVTA
jgi:hypothetical protein